MSTRKNTVLMAGYEVLIYLIPLIVAPYLSRVIGPAGIGIYSYTYSIAGYFVIIIQLGVSLYGRREIASQLTEYSRTQTFWGVFISISIMFVISIVGFCMLVIYFNESMKTALLAQIFVLIGAWLDISWFYFGIEDFKIAITRNIIVKVLSMLLIFIFVKSEDDSLKYVLIMSVSSLLSVAVMWISLPRKICKCKISIHDVLKHIKPLFILAIPVISIQLYSMTDKVILGLLMDIDTVGIYDNMYKLSRVPIALITTIGTVMLPRITNMIASGEGDRTYSYIHRSFIITSALGSLCCFGLIAISSKFVELYFGPAFNAGVPTLRILSLVLIVISIGNVFRTQFIIPRKLDSIYVISVVAAAVINILLNCLLIPILGLVGAAISSLIAEVVVCIYQCFKIRKSFNYAALFMQASKYHISAIIMCVAVMGFGYVYDEASLIIVVLQVILGLTIFITSTIVFEKIANEKVITYELKRLINVMVNRGY